LANLPPPALFAKSLPARDILGLALAAFLVVIAERI
jgi:hypothetical protein